MRAAAVACLVLLLALCALNLVSLHRLGVLTEDLGAARERRAALQVVLVDTAGRLAVVTGSWREDMMAHLKALSTGLDENVVRVDQVAKTMKDTQATVEDLRQLVRGLTERPKLPADGR